MRADRGIIFSAPMVRALLDGRKTQTRRVLKPAQGLTLGDMLDAGERDGAIIRCARGQVREPPYAPGDRLWVREAWGHDAPSLDDCRRGVEALGAMPYGPYYMADGGWAENHTIKRCSPIHMPRWASRMTLVVTEVRVERLHEISEEDAQAEGAMPFPGQDGEWWVPGKTNIYPEARLAFIDLWDSIHGPGSWAENPWVAAIRFTVHRCNIDALAGEEAKHGDR